MTMGWLETKQKEFIKIYGFNPIRIEISSKNMDSVYKDWLWPHPKQGGFMLNGVSVTEIPGESNFATFYFPDGGCSNFLFAPEAAEEKKVPSCDCGAQAVESSKHSNWCSTQGVA